MSGHQGSKEQTESLQLRRAIKLACPAWTPFLSPTRASLSYLDVFAFTSPSKACKDFAKDSRALLNLFD